MNVRGRIGVALGVALVTAALALVAWFLLRPPASDGASAEIAPRGDGAAPATRESVAGGGAGNAAAGTASAPTPLRSAPFAESRPSRTGAVRVRVVDAARRPRAAAVVTLRPLLDEPARPPATTDEDGRAEFLEVPFGRRQVIVAAPRAGAGYYELELRARRPVAEFEAILSDAPTVSKRVADADGYPVVGAVVRVPGSDDPLRLRTDEKGLFTAPAWWLDRLCVEASGFISFWGPAKGDQDVVLHRERAPLRGVVWAGDRPASGAAVVVRSLASQDIAGADEILTLKTEDDGSFIARTRMPGGELNLVVSFPGYLTEDLGGVPRPELPTDATVEPAALKIVLRRATPRRVHVTEADGTPVVGAAVFGHLPIRGRDGASFRTVTDAGGWCEFQEPEGALSLAIGVEVVGRRQEHFENPAPIDGAYRLRLEPHSYLEGRATDAVTGEPLPGAEIVFFDGWMYGPAAVADADGRWLVDRPHRDAWVTVIADGYLPIGRLMEKTGPLGATRVDTAHEAAVVVEVGPDRRYCGAWLRNDPDQTYLPRALTDRRSNGEAGPPEMGVAFDATGYAVFRRLRPGRQRIVVQGTDGLEQVLADRVFAPGETVRF